MSSAPGLRFLHCLPDGSALAELARTVGNLGVDAAHEIVFADDARACDKSALRDSGIEIAPNFPPLSKSAGPGKLIAIAQSLSGFDLVLTYGWSAITVALAHRVFERHLKLPPPVHHELGGQFSAHDEKSIKRKILRRIALGSAATVIVDSPGLQKFASSNWKIPHGRIKLLSRGLSLKDYRASASADALPGLVKRFTEKWIGAFLTDRNAEEVSKFISVLPEIPNEWQLVVMAGCHDASGLRTAAEQCEVSHRVHLLDNSAEESKALALLDIYADFEDEFSPALGAMKAVSAATVVIASRSSAAANYVSEANRSFLTPARDIDDMLSALVKLIYEDDLRKRIGSANRKVALASFGEAEAARAQGAIYGAALAKE